MAAHFSKTRRDHKKAFTFVVSGRNPESVSASVTQLCSELAEAGNPNVNIQGIAMDIDDDASIEHAVREVKQRFGQLDGECPLFCGVWVFVPLNGADLI